MDFLVLLVGLILELLSITTVRTQMEANLTEILGKESKCGDKMEYPVGHYHCTCDPECAQYGDCCRSSEYFKADQQRLGASSYSCKAFNDVGHYYVKASCPPDWDEDDTREKCENPDNTYADPLLQVPVLSVRTNITYDNGHCAICNQDIDPQADVFWNIDFKFEAGTVTVANYLKKTITFDFKKYLYYDLGKKSWFFNISDVDLSPIKSNLTHDELPKILKNDVTIVKPSSGELFPRRACVGFLVSTCPNNWTDAEVKGKCESYTDMYSNCGKTFRNRHCALCNNIDFNRICKVILLRRTYITSFSVPLDWETKTDVRCSEREKFDPLSSSCRKIGAEVIDPSIKQKFILAYITAVGVGISIMCLVLHLIVFVITPKLRNMPAMNLASLCVSLLLLYCTLIAGVNLGPPCRIIAIFTHYFLLVTFCWMLSISFDVWRAIRQIINNSIVSTEIERRKIFIFYCVFCWIVPVLIVTMALIFEYSDTGTDIHPDGTANCWVTNPDAILTFSFDMLCVIMGCNVIFFCWSAYLVYTSKSEIINSSKAPPMDFQIFIILGFIMGLTWITGLVAASVNVTALWYVFVLFNTLQCCFIFIAFSCTRKVWKETSSHFECCRCKNTSDASSDQHELEIVEP